MPRPAAWNPWAFLLSEERRAGLPLLPEGFKARMSTDGASYAFSVKDTLDPCHFALFSDQDGLIYNSTPIQ